MSDDPVFVESGPVDIGIVYFVPARWRQRLFPSARRRARKSEEHAQESLRRFADTIASLPLRLYESVEAVGDSEVIDDEDIRPVCTDCDNRCDMGVDADEWWCPVHGFRRWDTGVR